MKKVTLKKVLNFAVFCLMECCSTIFAQTLPAPPWPITSDYGPRMLSHWNFHQGIDYAGGYGEPITPVEEGVITRIAYLDGGWNLRIEGALGSWEYIHIFTGSGSLPVTSGNWELSNATLEIPSTGTTEQANIIILWVGNSAEKVLTQSQYSNRLIRIDGENYILGNDGKPILTRTSVSSTEPISPVGNSGEVSTHLHLEYRNGADNPLLHVQHPPDSLPRAAIESPPDGYVFTKEKLNSAYPIRIRANSQGGLDLDKVDILIYKWLDPSQAIHLGGNNTFCYGGMKDENKTIGTIIGSNGNSAGVCPLGTGDDRFIFLQNFGSLGLPDGKHLLVVKGTDINGNEIIGATNQFTIATNDRWTAALSVVYKEIAYTIDIPLFNIAGARNTSGGVFTKHLEHITEVAIKSENLNRYGNDFMGEVNIFGKEICYHYPEGCRDDCEGQDYEKEYPHVTTMSHWRYQKENNGYGYYVISFTANAIIEHFKVGIKEKDDKRIALNTVEEDEEHYKEIKGEICLKR